jgi:hypothetical protein
MSPAKTAAVDSIVSAVLYEGYVLYPYRPSSVKNRQRWTFGGLYPRSYSQAQGSAEPYSMQTQCLVLGDLDTLLEVKVRLLHILSRQVRELLSPAADMPADIEPASRPVEALRVGEKLFQTWQEATEREAGTAQAKLADILAEPRDLPFTFPARREVEPLRSPTGEVTGVLVREQQALSGSVTTKAEQVQDRLFKVTVQVLNLTPWEAGTTPGWTERLAHDDALLRAFTSTHTILSVENGEFVSLLDTPDAYHEAAAACTNTGTWPVLVGQEGERDMMLSSPIILYDYPQVAPESPGDLFDGTEIDEILTLRILTLTDEEKNEMRAVDERARALLDRTEALSGEQMMNMHGTIRNLMARQPETWDEQAEPNAAPDPQPPTPDPWHRR